MNTFAYSPEIQENARIIRESLAQSRCKYEKEEPVIYEFLRDEYHQALTGLKESGIIDTYKLRVLRYFVQQQKLDYLKFKEIVFTHQRG